MVGVAIVAGLLIVPSLVLLFRLSGRGDVGVDERPFRGGVTQGDQHAGTAGRGAVATGRHRDAGAGRVSTARTGVDHAPAVPLDPTAVQQEPRPRWVPYALCAGAVAATVVAGARVVRRSRDRGTASRT